MDILITILDEDLPTLTMLAKREWRGDHLDLQASAMFAEKIRAEKARASTTGGPRGVARRTPARGNGVVRVERVEV